MTGWTNLCLPYSKGLMNFACPDPSKRMKNFLACSKINQFCMNFSVLKMNMNNMEISQIQKKTYRWIPFFLLFFIPFIIVNSLMVSNIVPDALVSITGKGSERFLGQLPQEKNIQWELVFCNKQTLWRGAWPKILERLHDLCVCSLCG